MRELNVNEVNEVSGGLDPDSGGLAIIALGIGAATLGTLAAPAIAAAALVIGLGILFR